MSKDNQPQFSVHTPLHTELMLDMCALLSLYLASLLESMLSSTLFEGFGSGDTVICLHFTLWDHNIHSSLAWVAPRYSWGAGIQGTI
jgi:hypothetical protein